MQIVASEAGQYRLSYKLTDEKKHTIEGGYIFTIVGEGFDGRDFRFNHLELVQDKREYAPGQTVNLQVNTDRRDSTVLLFVRPANGVYLRPKVVRLKGKSIVEEIAVVKKDMPNFFVEAVTISAGKVHTEVKEIVVPPESRVLEVAVKPSAETYQARARRPRCKLKLTDFAGQAVRRLDGGRGLRQGASNTSPAARTCRRSRSSSGSGGGRTRQRQKRRSSGILAIWRMPSAQWMQNLGIFGESVVEEATDRMEMLGKRSDMLFRGGGTRMYAACEIDGIGRRNPRSCRGRGPGGRRPARSCRCSALNAPTRRQARPRRRRSRAADGPHELRRHRPVGGVAHDRRERHGRGVARHAREPDHLEGQGLGHGPRHEGRPGRGRGHHASKDLIVRLQAPRFFVEKDEVVLSRNVHNYLKNEKTVQVALELEGNCLAPAAKLDGDPDRLTRTIEVEAGGEQRVDWRVKVVREGQATVRMKALSDEESDATEQSFPVYVHGMLKMESFAGVAAARRTSRAQSTFTVPAERRVNESRLEVRYSPTLAGAMVDALPYLVDYPYGCTEQTLNRFLPTVITQKVLLEMGLDLQDDPGEAHQPQRPGDRRRSPARRRSGSASTATRSSTRTKCGRWSRTACSG